MLYGGFLFKWFRALKYCIKIRYSIETWNQQMCFWIRMEV